MDENGSDPMRLKCLQWNRLGYSESWRTMRWMRVSQYFQIIQGSTDRLIYWPLGPSWFEIFWLLVLVRESLRSCILGLILLKLKWFRMKCHTNCKDEVQHIDCLQMSAERLFREWSKVHPGIKVKGSGSIKKKEPFPDQTADMTVCYRLNQGFSGRGSCY